MSDSVTITTGARLHFGLLVSGSADKRRYGGIGLMIDQPGYSLTIRRAETENILAMPDTAARLTQFIEQLRPRSSPERWNIEVREEIPAHAGLGSGTQLGLAIAVATSRLRGEADIRAADLARHMGRGARSAIGTIGFESGGLIAHGEGQTRSDDPIRQKFPADWRLVLVTPPDHLGISGESERTIFREMSPMTELLWKTLIRKQCDLMTTAAIHDYPAFSRLLFEFGRTVGEYFAPVQSGIFASPRMAALAEKLRSDGIAGVGQTSWGPTLFALCDGQASAESIAAMIRRSVKWSDCAVRIVSAKNSAASIVSD